MAGIFVIPFLVLNAICIALSWPHLAVWMRFFANIFFYLVLQHDPLHNIVEKQMQHDVEASVQTEITKSRGPKTPWEDTLSPHLSQWNLRNEEISL